MLSIHSRITDLCQTVKQVASLPLADLRFESALNPDDVKKTYRTFTKPHSKYFVIKNKTVGVALIDTSLYSSADEYLASIAKRNCGGEFATRARARGCRLIEIDRNDYVDAIHAINISLPERQGRTMDESYLERTQQFNNLKNYRYYGVVNADGKLLAYCDVGVYGNFALLSRLLGYRQNDGVMHFLIVEIIRAMMNARKPRFAMYDTFFGASDGMRNFKANLGFRPYRARYTLT